jgi:hypothetical protein
MQFLSRYVRYAKAKPDFARHVLASFTAASLLLTLTIILIACIDGNPAKPLPPPYEVWLDDDVYDCAAISLSDNILTLTGCAGYDENLTFVVGQDCSSLEIRINR